MEKIYWQITVAAFMQPLKYDLRSLAAKDNSMTHAGAVPSNLDAAITMRSAETELQNTIELRATASEMAAPKPDGSRRQTEKKTILKHFLKGFLKGKFLAPKWRKSTDKSLSQPSCSHSNTIYQIQLQKTIAWRMQAQCQATSTQPLQCVLQRHVANLHVSTHVATSDDDNHAAISLRSATTDSKNAKNYTHRNNRSLQNTEEEHIRDRNDRSRNRRTHEVPFIAGCSHFARKNTRFRAPASSTKPIEHSCSHYNAFCSISWLTRISLRTWQHQMTTIMQPFHRFKKTNRIAHRNNHSLQNTEEEHIRDRNDRSRNRRTHEVPFIAGCSHFARKNPRFRAPASSPQRASLPHHFPSSPPLTTSLRHHFPSSPLPIVTTSLHHHLPSSPLPFVTTSLPHHFPSSPFPFFTTLCHSFLFFCYVLWCDVPPFINVKSQNSICPYRGSIASQLALIIWRFPKIGGPCCDLS